jgi:hypothetical protein
MFVSGNTINCKGKDKEGAEKDQVCPVTSIPVHVLDESRAARIERRDEEAQYEQI